MWLFFSCIRWRHPEKGTGPPAIHWEDRPANYPIDICWYLGVQPPLTNHILVGGLEHFLFSISYMGCHPSHWLSYFSRWLLHHQPDLPIWFFWVIEKMRKVIRYLLISGDLTPTDQSYTNESSRSSRKALFVDSIRIWCHGQLPT